MEVDFVLRNGKFKAIEIDDEDDDDRGELTGTITQLTDKYIVISGIKIKRKKAEIDDDAPFYVEGRPEVEFYPKKFDKLIATEIDGDDDNDDDDD